MPNTSLTTVCERMRAWDLRRESLSETDWGDIGESDTGVIMMDGDRGWLYIDKISAINSG